MCSSTVHKIEKYVAKLGINLKKMKKIGGGTQLRFNLVKEICHPMIHMILEEEL